MYPIWVDAIGVLAVIGLACLLDTRRAVQLLIDRWRHARKFGQVWNALTYSFSVLLINSWAGLAVFSFPRSCYDRDTMRIVSVLIVVAALLLILAVRRRKLRAKKTSD